MYQLTVKQHFDAAHYLRGYRGKCEALHGHSFLAVVQAQASRLDDAGMAYDFTELKSHLRDVLSRLDHTCLNDIPPFDEINPSSENIAATIYKEIKDKLADAPISLTCVEVWESLDSGASYRPD